MTNRLKAAVLLIGLAIPLLQVSNLAAQPSKPAPPAPIPAQILGAKRVFIGNGGGDQPFLEEPLFNGGPDRTYNQFYAALKASGRYELVGAAADADLLFEIHFTVPRVDGRDQLLAIPYDPQFRLVIRDPKTNALLWAFTEHVQWAILQGNRDKNFDQALAKIVADLHTLGGEQASAASAAKP